MALIAENKAALTSAIEDAVKTHNTEEPVKIAQDLTVDPPVEKQEPLVVEGREEEEEPEVDEEAIQGKSLVQALKDPARAGQVIDFLARQAGYTKSDITTKQDVKTVKEDITAILEEELGPDLKFIAPQLGKALDKVLSKIQVQNTSGPELENVSSRLNQIESERIQNEVASTHVELSQAYFGADDVPDNVAKALSQAMDTFKPPEDMSPRKYYQEIFNLVAGKLGLQKKSSRGGLVQKNQQSEPARNLTTLNRGRVPTADGQNAKKMTLNKAIELAVSQVNSAATRK